MTPDTIVLGAAFVAMLIWSFVREAQHQKIIRDLTAKIMAKDLDEYKTVAESLPLRIVKKVEDKPRKINDPVLGSTF